VPVGTGREPESGTAGAAGTAGAFGTAGGFGVADAGIGWKRVAIAAKVAAE